MKTINCLLGKHNWEKIYVKDNKYDAWECKNCGQKKYSLDLRTEEEKKADEIKKIY